MKLIEIQDRTKTIQLELFQIWESSVRATHTFLSEEEIQKIAQYVPEALKEIPVLIAAKNDVGEYTAFMGLDDKKISMLFVSDQERHKGIGKMLIRYGIEHYGINEVCVNVQNPQAVCFYEHLGFKCYKQSELDEQGNPYPILYLKLN